MSASILMKWMALRNENEKDEYIDVYYSYLIQ